MIEHPTIHVVATAILAGSWLGVIPPIAAGITGVYYLILCIKQIRDWNKKDDS